MSKIGIYHLAKRRPLAVDVIIPFLSKMQNKNLIEFFFLCDDDFKRNGLKYDEYAKRLNDAGIRTRCIYDFKTGNSNYISKINFAVSQDLEYAMKLDEDIFMNHNVMDFMVEHHYLLNDDKNLLISPVLSNGIPTCDMFVSDFFNDAQKDEIYNLFMTTSFCPFWGVDYAPLNKVTINRPNEKWNEELFYQEISKINHHYRGMHPVRIRLDINMRINDLLLGDWSKFCSCKKENMKIMESERPYFCNSIFLIKTKRWREIVQRTDLSRDAFDEVNLNLYRLEKSMKWLFIRNGFAMHTVYNTVSWQQPDYENRLIESVLHKNRENGYM